MKKFNLVLLFFLPCQLWAFDHSHSKWAGILKSYVVVQQFSSTVKYQQLKGQSEFLSYLNDLKMVKREEFDKFSSPQRLAFLINAYNAFTVQLILDHYPVKSIKDIGGLLSSPWKKKFFKLFGEDTHLDQIEHEMIRKKFKESRIHFAVVCASIGCPMLRVEPFVATKLEQQLEESAVTFLRDPSRNKFDGGKKILELSSIFKWYEKDFTAEAGDLKKYVAARMGKNAAEIQSILDPKVEVSFGAYDWSLNDDR